MVVEVELNSNHSFAETPPQPPPIPHCKKSNSYFFLFFFVCFFKVDFFFLQNRVMTFKSGSVFFLLS